MAFNTYNNNKEYNDRSITVYSKISMGNPESKIDPTRLSFKYWKTNLCISINPRKNTGNDEVSYDMDNGISIYLNHTKCEILKNEIELFLKDPVTYSNVGVTSGQAAITISNGVEYGKNTPVMTIRKINNEGQVVSSFAYEFKTNYHFAIRDYTGSDFRKEFEAYNNIEIKEFITILDEYCKAATTAVAFTVMDQQYYSRTRLENKIDAIANNLGVELPNSSNQKRFSSNSYFNSVGRSNESSEYSSNVSYETGTLDDLDD